MIQFLADADLNQKIVGGLRRREPLVDLLDAHEAKVIGLSDPEILALAAKAGRVVVSHDVNTMPSHFYRFIEQRPSPGLVIVTQEMGIGEAIEALLVFWTLSKAGQIQNQVRHLQALPGD